jgi:outer membrane protein TolC
MRRKLWGMVPLAMGILLDAGNAGLAQQTPMQAGRPAPMETEVHPPVRGIDLPAALRLAAVYNPEIQLARERVAEAVAFRQLAAAQILPTVNSGMDINHHQGNLQQSTGQIIKLDRDSLDVGLGTGTVGAGTVNIPGIYWNANVSDVYYGNLISKQVVRQRGFASDAVRNDVLLRVATAYLDLLRSHGKRRIAELIRDDAAEVARVTKNFADTGQGRQSDADRAATEREMRQGELVETVNEMEIASARLCQLLNLDPSVRLNPDEPFVVPSSLVPEPIPLPELLVIALTQRPELRERQAAIRAALLELQHQKALPFSPQIAFGYSVGEFGGGSTLVATRFGDFGNRQDLDAIMYWSVRNLGVGNLAQIRAARSVHRQQQLNEVIVLDRVRSEVASARARVLARGAQIDINEKAIRSSQNAFKQDMLRTRNKEGLPIEVLDSLRLLARSRFAYLDAIIDYNVAHFELYVALGQPPADVLARPVPAKAIVAPQ